MTDLGSWPDPVVRIACERCKRAGRYHRDKLIAKYGDPTLSMDIIRATLVGPCHAGRDCVAHLVVAEPEQRRWMSVGDLASELRRQPCHLPALIGASSLLPVRQVRVVGVDMQMPVRMKHYGAPALIILGE